MSKLALERSLKIYNKRLKRDSSDNLSGLLGIGIDGRRSVEVPGRNSYVYVRIRGVESELIQAFNDRVPPVYDLPVILTRQGNKYRIKERDIDRYDDWGGNSSFVPSHGNQHSLVPDVGGGGDPVWVDSRQFLPLGVTPSGSFGSPYANVMGYNIKTSDGSWIYAGNTGTPDLLMYRPDDDTAIMVLVYMDKDTGNPGILVGSGTFSSSSITGTNSIAPYIPTGTSSSQIPLGVVRLVSGTSFIGWDNIYDLREWHSSSAGSSALSIKDEGVLQGVATTLNFVGDPVDVSVVGSEARIFITGSAGGGTSNGLIDIYDDSSIILYSGTAISFDENLDVSVTGSIAYVQASVYTLRKLQANLTIPDTGNLIVTEYFDLDIHTLTLEGDSVLEVIE
ncbi:hypothetical protein HN960_05425 [Candidatus Peregrinibacteria bacterium]|jgi:hypothetical protein|nr:hypothetical protein [Candidatus Peregrinibacteria bacterium]MBT7009843.1 hypothetical protein [Candidatus Peregrinibacteria bacterium]